MAPQCPKCSVTALRGKDGRKTVYLCPNCQQVVAETPVERQERSVTPKNVIGRRQTSKQRYQAKGRLPAGTMNQTEAAYAEHLELLRQTGEIKQFWFEAMTLKIAKDCRYTVDFLILNSDDYLEGHEVKGGFGFTDDSLVKIKVAAAAFPIRFRSFQKLPKKDGGGWKEREF